MCLWKMGTLHAFYSIHKDSDLGGLEQSVEPQNYWGSIVLCCSDCSVHCCMFSSICSLCPLDITNNLSFTPLLPPSWMIRNVYRHHQKSTGDKIVTLLISVNF